MSAVETCALCPRLCRWACPVAVGSAREAAVPTFLATAIVEHAAGRMSASRAAAAVALCTDCGACGSACHIHQPLPALLRDARAALLRPAPIEPLRPIEGVGARVAVETDERPWADALAAALGEPVRRWFTADALGVGAIDHAMFEERASQLRVVLADLEVVVAHGGVARALRRAGVPFSWLHEVLPALAGDACGSCEAPGGARPLACCGAAGPLLAHHPADAARVAEAWLARRAGPVADARCRAHFESVGQPAEDAVDRLLASRGNRG